MIISFLARLTPACKDVTHLVSEGMDHRLPWPVRVKLRLHYWICDACANYRRQLLLIRRSLGASRSVPTQDQSNPPLETRTRLTEAFRKQRR